MSERSMFDILNAADDVSAAVVACERDPTAQHDIHGLYNCFYAKAALRALVAAIHADREATLNEVPRVKDVPSIDGVRQSEVYSILLSPAMLDDPLAEIQPLVELAAAMLLDKPIITLQVEGVEVPKAIRKVSDLIVPFSQDKVKEASKQMAAFIKERFPKEEHER